MMNRSKALFTEAQLCISGGVNSPVRAFQSVGGTPIFFKRGEGSHLYDEDDRCYVDYVGSWGAMIAGHANPVVVRAVNDTVANGISFGTPTTIETAMACKIKELMPSIQLIRMCNSGTEATMSAVRLARGFTSRNKILKFEGCYHGHSDSLLVRSGSGALTLGIPTSPGIPASLATHTVTSDYNDILKVREVFAQIGCEIAGVIVEPVAGNMNCILPAPGFLEVLRELCDQYDSILIFDEVMTGFRVALGGAQQLYGITPDLTTLGKVIGGGMPVGALGGRKDIMEKLAPIGPIYQAGTLSGNPLVMAAGLATLNFISSSSEFYTKLTSSTQHLCDSLVVTAQKARIPLTVNHVGGMFGIFFAEQSVNTYRQATACDFKRFRAFFHGMLAEGIYLAPSPFEAGFISSAHTGADISTTISAAQRVFSHI